MYNRTVSQLVDAVTADTCGQLSPEWTCCMGYSAWTFLLLQFLRLLLPVSPPPPPPSYQVPPSGSRLPLEPQGEQMQEKVAGIG